MQTRNRIKRRDFINYAAGMLPSIPAFSALGQPISPKTPAAGFSLSLGVCTSYDKAGLLKSKGYSFVEKSVSRFLIPDAGGDAQYETNRLVLSEDKFPIRSYIYFFPGKLKSVWPDLHHEAIMARSYFCNSHYGYVKADKNS